MNRKKNFITLTAGIFKDESGNEIFNNKNFQQSLDNQVSTWFNSWFYDLTVVYPIKKTMKDVEKIKIALNTERSKIDKFYETSDKNLSGIYDAVSDHTQCADIKHIISSLINNHLGTKMVITNAWLKMFEMLSLYRFSVKRPIKHFANAELPGNFVMAAKAFARLNNVEYDYLGSSYLSGGNTTLEDVYGTMKNEPNNWIIPKYDGNMTNIDSVKRICEDFESSFNLYSSDGGIPMTVSTFNEQENITMSIKMGEIITGVHLLDTDSASMGIVKIYTFFEKRMLLMINYLRKLFTGIIIAKPFTSKPGSAELYIIMRHKKKNLTADEKDMLYKIGYGDIDDLSVELDKAVFDAMKESTSRQIYQIIRNVQLSNAVVSDIDKMSIVRSRYRVKLEHNKEFLDIVSSKFYAYRLLAAYLYCRLCGINFDGSSITFVSPSALYNNKTIEFIPGNKINLK